MEKLNLAKQIDGVLKFAESVGYKEAAEYLKVHAAKESGVPKHMWEAVHSYYMTDYCYWGSNSTQHYSSWKDFLETEDNADFDYNMIFRWDWKPVTGDEEYGEVQAKLHIYWATQRKGYLRVTIICVNKQDEPEIRKWLHPAFEHLLKLWEPFVWVDDLIPDHAVRKDCFEGFQCREGTCESCDFNPVRVYPFDDQREHRKYDRHTGVTEVNDAGKEKIWLCQLCASGWTGTATQYPEQYENAKTLQTFCKAVNSVLAKLDEKKDYNQDELTAWLKENLKGLFSDHPTV